MSPFLSIVDNTPVAMYIENHNKCKNSSVRSVNTCKSDSYNNHYFVNMIYYMSKHLTVLRFLAV